VDQPSRRHLPLPRHGMGGRGGLRQLLDDVYSLGVTAYRLLAGAYPPNEITSEHEELPPKPEPLRAPKGLDEKCPELGALILRMLAEDPLARGSAKEVAEELERLLKRPGPGLDRPWTVSWLQPPTEETWRPTPARSYLMRARVPLLAAAIVMLLMLLGVLSMRDVGQKGVAHTHPQGTPQVQENPEESTVGMGSGSIASPLPYEGLPPSERATISAEPVPTGPLPGQKRPPCSKRAEAEINGGCWTPAKGEDPPCNTGWYEHGGVATDPCFTRCVSPLQIRRR
jgi:serine/threonine protein kinase